MKIGAYSSLPRVSAVDRPRGTARSGAGVATREASVDAPRAVEVSDFFGVPEGELTPKVREALLGLMDEVDSLRRDKYWPPVNRVDNVYGDRNLFCACPSIESYREES